MALLTEVAEWIAGITAVVAGTPRTAASVNAGLTDLASRTKWVNERIYKLLFGSGLTVSSVDTATDRLTVTSHGLGSNTPVQLFAVESGALPGGLAISTVYYVDVIDANTIKLSATDGPGAAVDLTAGFVGPVYVQAIPNWQNYMLLNASTYGIGKLTDLVMFLAGTQTITGTKTFASLIMSGVTTIALTSRSLTRAVNTVWCKDDGTTVGIGGIVTLIGASASDWYTDLDLPHGQLLTGIRVMINPTNVGALPGTMPSITIEGYSLTTGAAVASAAGSFTDNSPDTATYNVAHDLVISGLTHTIDREANGYRLTIRGSSGATPANDILAYPARPVVTVTSMKLWA